MADLDLSIDSALVPRSTNQGSAMDLFSDKADVEPLPDGAAEIRVFEGYR